MGGLMAINVLWITNSATGVQLPACARSRMLTLSKSTTFVP